MSRGRFDYVRYDGDSMQDQAEIKVICEDLEDEIMDRLPEGRARDEALKALEVAYMWCGKGIRDKQIEKNGRAEPNESRDPDAVSGPTVADPHDGPQGSGAV